MTTGRKFRTEAMIAEILSELTDDWQRSSALVEKMRGPDLDYDERYSAHNALSFYFRKMVRAGTIECEKRSIEGRRVNFYRRTQFLPQEGGRP